MKSSAFADFTKWKTSKFHSDNLLYTVYHHKKEIHGTPIHNMYLHWSLPPKNQSSFWIGFNINSFHGSIVGAAFEKFEGILATLHAWVGRESRCSLAKRNDFLTVTTWNSWILTNVFSEEFNGNPKVFGGSSHLGVKMDHRKTQKNEYSRFRNSKSLWNHHL